MLEEDYENQEVIKILNELNNKEISVCKAYEKIESHLLKLFVNKRIWEDLNLEN